MLDPLFWRHIAAGVGFVSAAWIMVKSENGDAAFIALLLVLGSCTVGNV